MDRIRAGQADPRAPGPGAFPRPPDVTRYGFYVGTSGYAHSDWLGTFFPRGLGNRHATDASGPETPLVHQLRYYQMYFPFVEISAAVHQEPPAEHFREIAECSGPAAMYAVRVHRSITHTTTWNAGAAKESMRKLISAVGPLIETGRLYTFLIQLEDPVYREQKKLDYLLEVSSEAVSRKLDVHIEFRHQSWHAMYPLQALRDNGIGICNTELPPLPHAFPLRSYATTEKGYVRYSGRNLDSWNADPDLSVPADRTTPQQNRCDYLYSAEEIQGRVAGQVALSEKVGCVAVVFANQRGARSAANAIQNVRLLHERFSAEEARLPVR